MQEDGRSGQACMGSADPLPPTLILTKHVIEQFDNFELCTHFITLKSQNIKQNNTAKISCDTAACSHVSTNTREQLGPNQPGSLADRSAGVPVETSQNRQDSTHSLGSTNSRASSGEPGQQGGAAHEQKAPYFSILGRTSVDIIKSSGYKVGAGSGMSLQSSMAAGGEHPHGPPFSVRDSGAGSARPDTWVDHNRCNRQLRATASTAGCNLPQGLHTSWLLSISCVLCVMWPHVSAALVCPEPTAPTHLPPSVLQQALHQHCLVHLAPYQSPRRFIVLNAPLPRNPMGKINKKELLQLFFGKELQAASNAMPSGCGAAPLHSKCPCHAKAYSKSDFVLRFMGSLCKGRWPKAARCPLVSQPASFKVLFRPARAATWWRGHTALLSQCVSLTDVGRVSSTYVAASYPAFHKPTEVTEAKDASSQND
eukprot:482654-Pelagomonas_calceolata.AAC.4